ncbi:MAG: molybdenum cofactor guanylyltransferase [Cardiobacteriaceae bacterium]|nr:molybdenum cofactor guanylyltransferase [Cardiobacteriaceae bacterium]
MNEYLIILCGGRSQRMGEDKALLVHEGETLLARHIRLAQAAGFTVCVASGGTDYPLPPGVIASTDALPDREGPLSALTGALAALQDTGAESALLMPVDTLVTPAQLAAALPETPAPFACVIADGTPQPLFARIALALQPRLAAWLADGVRRMMPLAALPGVRYVPLPADWPQPFSFNTPADWQAAQGERA